MVKSVLSSNRKGVRDWIIQRLSAVFMAIYSIALTVYVIVQKGITYKQWSSLFSQPWMKIATLIVMVSLLYHAWIGIWTVFTDYVKAPILRGLLNVLVLLMLASCFIWGLMIVWSV